MIGPKLCLIALIFTGVTPLACAARTAAVQPASSGASAIQISETEPPAGATSLGSIEGVHGHGCGVFGKDGTREGATIALQESAAKRGANYVQIVDVIEPHPTRRCFEHTFRIRGVAYRLAGTAQPRKPCVPACAAGYACREGACEPLCNPPCPANHTCRLDRTCVPRAITQPGD